MIFSRPVARRALVLTLLGQAVTAVILPSSARAAATTVFTPVADASVYSGKPGTNFGSDPTLVADNSPKTKAFLRFDVAGLTAAPTGARLRVWVTNASSNGPEVRPVTSPWGEAAVTYDTRASVGSVVADVGKVSAGKWLEYNVSALVTGSGRVDLAMVGDSSDGTDFVSREGSAAERPQLVVETGTEPPPPPPPPGDAFSFGLIGDTGYTSSSVTKFLHVRDAMNAASLDFVTHIGDIKSGDDPCPDSVYSTNLDRFNGFTDPLVYTPGDNEWRDCSDKVGRLDHLRGVFFSDNHSLGDPSLTLTRQSAAFPENALWHEGPITFVTLHTVGLRQQRRPVIGVRAPQRGQHRLAAARLRRRRGPEQRSGGDHEPRQPGFPARRHQPVDQDRLPVLPRGVAVRGAGLGQAGDLRARRHPHLPGRPSEGARHHAAQLHPGRGLRPVRRALGAGRLRPHDSPGCSQIVSR